MCIKKNCINIIVIFQDFGKILVKIFFCNIWITKVLENNRKIFFPPKSQPGACFAVCLIFLPISLWRPYKLHAYKKILCIAKEAVSYFRRI